MLDSTKFSVFLTLLVSKKVASRIHVDCRLSLFELYRLYTERWNCILSLRCGCGCICRGSGGGGAWGQCGLCGARAVIMQDVGDRLLRLEKLAQEKSLSSWLRVLEDRSTFWKGKTLQTRVCKVNARMPERSVGCTAVRGVHVPS